jgi:anti-sigma regulatory factor (Ser/Thr protein kinase)
MRRSRRFVHAPESVTSARRFASEVLQGAPDDVRDAVALMISEVASNCIRHTDTGFELTIIQTAATIRVEATDRGGGAPTMRSPGPTDPDGRGLRIVDMLSSSWGFDPLPAGGKTVWFAVGSQPPAERERPGLVQPI